MDDLGQRILRRQIELGRRPPTWRDKLRNRIPSIDGVLEMMMLWFMFIMLVAMTAAVSMMLREILRELVRIG